MTDHFYVTLPSNSSYAYYGQQEPCKFRTKLAKAIALRPEEWEVGLAELSYPRSWACLPGAKYTVYVPHHGGPDVPREDRHFELANTRYDTASALVAALDAQVKASLRDVTGRKDPAFTLDARTRRTRVRLTRANMVRLSAELASPLGFGSEKKVFLCRGGTAALETDKARVFVSTDSTIKSPFAAKPDRLVTELYLYADVVQRQRVGDSLVPLLRTVADTGEEGREVVSIDFRHIHYVALETGSFESIDIAVSDSLGRPIRFQFGEVIVKLHFRRRQP